MRPAAFAVAAFLLAGCVQVQVGGGADPIEESATTTAVRTPRLSIHAEPAVARVGQAVQLEVRASGLADGDALAAARWTFGDDSTASGLTAAHAFAKAGSFAVGVRATTERGATASGSSIIEVVNGAVPPAKASSLEANLDPPIIQANVTGSLVEFSFTSDQVLDLVHWSFGDGATSDELAPQHSYMAKGTFIVTLRAAVDAGIVDAVASVEILEITLRPRVVVGVSDSGINPYHEIYYRPGATAHPCTYVAGYTDCSIPALPLSVGPGFGSYGERLQRDRAVWSQVRTMTWYWIPNTAFIAVHCPEPYEGDVTTTGTTYASAICILDDTQTHGTQTTSSVLTEAPESLLVFNEGSGSAFLAGSPVPIDIESNSWGSLAPLYGGLVNGPTGQQLCHDSIDSPTSLKFRSAGNNGPWPNMGDCSRNGYRTYSVSGGYPDGTHGELSGSTPDFASYWCRPVALPDSTDAWDDSCGTSFAAPTAAGTAAATLLGLRRHLDYVGGSSTTEVAPGVTHEAFMDALLRAATYEPEARDGFPSGSVYGPVTAATPWLWWGWGWLDAQVVPQAVACATGGSCPDNKSPEAWAFNDARRAFASDGDPL